MWEKRLSLWENSLYSGMSLLIESLLQMNLAKTQLLIAATALFVACGTEPQKNQAPAATENAAQTEITTAVRGFFNWYNAFVSNPNSANYHYIDDSGEHLRLNNAALDAFLGEFVKSGFAGKTFVENEKKAYADCEKLWANEPKDEVPSRIDHDRYFCAQEDVTDYYKNAAVEVRLDDASHATATLVLDMGEGGKHNRIVKMQKEDGKWLVADCNCELTP